MTKRREAATIQRSGPTARRSHKGGIMTEEHIDITCPECGDGCAACFDAGRAQLQSLLDLNTRVLRLIQQATKRAEVIGDATDRADMIDLLTTTDMTALPTRYVVPRAFVEIGALDFCAAFTRREAIDVCTEYGIEVES